MATAFRKGAHVDDGLNCSAADKLGELIRGCGSVSEGQQSFFLREVDRLEDPYATVRFEAGAARLQTVTFGHLMLRRRTYDVCGDSSIA